MNSISAAAAALVSLGLLAAPTADANEVGFYIGANYGLVNKQVDRTDYDEFASDVHFFFSYTPTQESISFDESDQTFNLQAGYRINRFLAIEGAYADLGQITYRSQSQGMFPMDRGTINTTVESETSGFVVSALGVLPLTYGWEIYARVGALFATNRFKINLRRQRRDLCDARRRQHRRTSFPRARPSTWAASASPCACWTSTTCVSSSSASSTRALKKLAASATST